MSADQDLVDAVAAQLLRPLVLGGAVSPVPPIGEKRALALANEPLVASDDDLPVLRLRAARALAPVDALPDPDAGEWLCAFALNDLLQVTNPSLDGVFNRHRAVDLLAMAERVVAHARAPASVGEALARHATFGRLAELVREDTRVSWWVGHADFRGTKPPARLLAWPRVRRVQSETARVELADMPPPGVPWAARWVAAMERLIAASPLTALSALGHRGRDFEWSGAILDLVGVPMGRTLALRVVERAGEPTAAVAAARTAAGRLAEDAARRVALAFADELEALAAARKAG